MHDYLVYHAKARTEGINIFQYTRVGLIDKIMQYIVGISLTVRVIFGINNVTVMMHTKIIIIIDVASVPSGLISCKIVLCVGIVVTI